ncbi:hypothetical protein [Photobacterium leiognathi]|uniref:hypothetical protein n=1 Tax=Photobacterium leiognathi TaxID=553611 RepID=UPI0027393323|nr:hypothetical protein [Photobacterium leiognathi]
MFSVQLLDCLVQRQMQMMICHKGIAVQILSQLQDSGQVNYVNAENWLIDKKQSVNQNATSSLTLIKKSIEIQ